MTVVGAEGSGGEVTPAGFALKDPEFLVEALDVVEALFDEAEFWDADGIWTFFW